MIMVIKKIQCSFNVQLAMFLNKTVGWFTCFFFFCIKYFNFGSWLFSYYSLLLPARESILKCLMPHKCCMLKFLSCEHQRRNNACKHIIVDIYPIPMSVMWMHLKLGNINRLIYVPIKQIKKKKKKKKSP